MNCELLVSCFLQAASYDFLPMEKLIEGGLLMVGSLQWAVGEISWQFAVGSWRNQLAVCSGQLAKSVGEIM